MKSELNYLQRAIKKHNVRPHVKHTTWLGNKQKVRGNHRIYTNKRELSKAKPFRQIKTAKWKRKTQKKS